jgi:peptidoglycan/LPS O-acetylase OafA/YrhL
MTPFRSEIAGLRALAVASVVLFHLKLQAFQGGFVGVDVFFVISGYLITRNILRELHSGQFSMARFYARRIRRIYPALIFTVAATYAVGALWCSPLMFLDLAKECTHALLSIANIQYWRESHQYFAPKSDQLALLHCWSLSLEEQFYLLWPLLVVLAAKTGRALIGIAVISGVTLAAAIMVGASDSSATFFLTPFRMYEFGLGALVIFAERLLLARRSREALSFGGALAVVASALTLRAEMPHLELLVLIPCLGAAAVILGGGKTGTGRLLSQPIAVGLGGISHSLYLCHWPIIYFAHFIFGDVATGVVGTTAIIVITLAVATFMRRFVEIPLIESPTLRESPPRKTFAMTLAVVLPLAAVTHTTFVTKGFPWRLPASQQESAHLLDFPSGRDIDPVSGPVGFLLIGDSHAAQYLAGLSPLRQRLGLDMEVQGGAGCPILYAVTLNDSRRRQACIELRDRALARVEQTNLPIIFVLSWSRYDDAMIEFDSPTAPNSHSKGSYLKLEEALKRTMGRFAAAHKQVLLLGAQVNANCPFDRARLLPGPLPHVPLPPCPAGARAVAETSGAPFNAMLTRIQAQSPETVKLLRPVDYFCNVECATMDGGLWLYFDETHFTVSGSRYMVRRIERPLTEFLRTAHPHGG